MIRESIFGGADELGDLAAPPGTPAWAVAVRLQIQHDLHSVNFNTEQFRCMLELFQQHKGHQLVDDRHGRPFATFAGFCASPVPFGLGTPLDEIRRLLGGSENPLRIFVEEQATVGPGGVNNPAGRNQHAEEEEVNHNNVMVDHSHQGGVTPRGDQGNSIGYSVRRLSRERPDLLDRVKAGEFSAHRAMIEAGFRKPTITLPLDPEAAARLILKHFQGEALEALVRSLVAYSRPTS